MKKLLMMMIVAALTLSVGISSVEARRLGGGGSFGKQSQGVSRQAPTQSATNNQAKSASPAAAPATPAPKPASPWRGILGGALLGLGLGALFSHLGMGGAMASMLGTLLMVALLAGAAMFIYRMWRRKAGGNDSNHSQPAYAGESSNYMPEIGSRIEPMQPAAFRSDQLSGGAAAVAAPWGIPSGFDVPAFLRHAKTYYIWLQAAWDKADINDIREFTTPEMFAELKLQIQERGASANHTDVVQLDADVLGMETVGNDHLVSVKFSGMIKESEQAPAEPFAEVWNLSKPMSGQGGWVLAGIQQLS
jgi:predicted lipid-binding transport protein (Tim44 family)